MKVILQKDVAKLGKRHTVVVVPDGYALNKLIPQGLATPATPESLKRLKHAEAETAAHTAADEQAYAEALKAMIGKTISISAEANAQGHLFKAVKANDIYDALVVQGVTAIPLSAIVISEPIKACGEHTIQTKLHDKAGSFIITVIAKSS